MYVLFKMTIFAMWFEKEPRHRGERLSFDPPVNLQNSSNKGKSLKGCFSCSNIYTAYSLVESAHIYTCRCEQIFITGIPALGDEGDAFEVKTEKEPSD